MALLDKPVFWVVLSLFLVSLPYAFHQPKWLSLYLIILFVWRLIIEIRQTKLPSKYTLLLLTLASFSAILGEFSTITGKTAGSALLITLLSVKLLESQKPRDFKIIISLCFFIMSVNFMFSQTIPTLIFMLFSIPVLLISFMRLSQPDSPLNFKQDLAMVKKLSLLALPLMLVLFILFPRLPGPLWKLPSDQADGQTGLSERMTPGNISRLIQSPALAFRVKFHSPLPLQSQLYWRGMVLWSFDGKNWTRGAQNLSSTPEMLSLSQTINYTLTLEPHNKKWIFALDMPYQAAAQTFYNNDYLLRSKYPVDRLKQFQLNASLNYRISEKLSPWEKTAGLAFPVNKNPQTIALAKQWKRQYKNPQLIIQQALRLFNQKEFIYTLEPPLAMGADPVDDFLFNSRKGFCQHYASSFTLLMRAAGIPARVVLGYQGGTFNPLNHVLSVRQSDAHAWTEVWLQAKGWTRIDPTAAVSPSRVEQSVNAALANSHSQTLYMRLNTGLFKQLNLYWDALDNSWKQWVIGYNAKRQNDLLSAYLDRQISSQQLIIYLITATGIVTLILSIFIFRPFYRPPLDPAKKLYEKFCYKLEKRGVKRGVSQGPEDFARIAIQAFPQQRQAILNITRLFVSIQYQSKQNPQQINKLKYQLSRFTLTKNQ